MRKKALQVRGQVAQKWPPWESRGALVYDDLGRIWKNSKEFERIWKNLESIWKNFGYKCYKCSKAQPLPCGCVLGARA